MIIGLEGLKEVYKMDEISRLLNIPYIKLHFELALQEDCILSANKASALRGGMGQMLLRSCCVQDRDCDNCIFSNECLVQRIMYSPFDIKPFFVTKGESMGFHLECENYQREFSAGDSLHFQMTLFGKAIVYFYQILQAFYMLGQEGLGERRARYLVTRVSNTNREVIVEDTMIDMSRYRIRSLNEYVDYRLQRAGKHRENRMIFHTPVSIKYNKTIQTELTPEAVLAALCRRIYMFDCYAGIETEQLDFSDRIPVMTDQTSRPSVVRRHSTTHGHDIVLRGIKGYMDFEEIDPDLRRLLYAGEIMHIGKNTRFGFGRYTMVEP